MMYKHRFFAWTMSVSLLLLFVPLAGATTYYVSVSSGDDTNSGLSWAEAKAGIQPAIDLTSDGDSVLVSNGTYLIGRYATVSISNAIVLESMNGPSNTIIDNYPYGDWEGSLQPCVLITNNNAIVDGFTIQNRRVEGDNSNPTYGSGVLLHGGSLTNCIVKNNGYLIYAKGHGAGIYCVNAEIANCQIISNSCNSDGYDEAYNAYGGGIYAINSTIKNCTIDGNLSLGGETHDPTFGWSYASGYGGGIYCINSTIFTCTFRDNYAEDNGGGVYCTDSSIIACTFRDNHADNDGGGIHADSSTSVQNCTLRENEADRSGAGLYGGQAYNCAIMQNRAAASGGGCTLSALFNSSVVANHANNRGGGVYNGSSFNCIIYYNSADSNCNHDGTACSYTCTTPLPSGSGNFTNEPHIASLGNPHILTSSPCIDTGQNQGWMPATVDLDGDNRIINGTADIGVDELSTPNSTGDIALAIQVNSPTPRRLQTICFTAEVSGIVSDYFWNFDDGSAPGYGFRIDHAFSNGGTYQVTLTASNQSETTSTTQTISVISNATFYVATNGNDGASGLSWNEPRKTIQSALNSVNPNESITVSNGTYHLLNELLLNKPGLLLQSVNGETTTIIDGCGTSRCINICATGIVVDGFTIHNGGGVQNGGGVCMTNGTLSNCSVWECQAGYTSGDPASGGGVYIAEGRMINCTLSNNSAYGAVPGQAAFGGGVYAQNAYLSNCQISASTAQGARGFECMYDCCGGNGAIGEGGGIYAMDSVLACCSISNSHARGGRGGAGGLDMIYYEYLPGGNGASAAGGGIQAHDCTLSDITLCNNGSYGGSGGSGNEPGYGAQAVGGGISANESKVTNIYISGCSVSGGSGRESIAKSYGGGACNGTFNNALIISNFANYRGGGTCGTILNNCTIIDNAAGNMGGGMHGGSALNCIVYYNTAPTNSNNSECSMQYSCTLPAPSGAGNISDDPEFTDRANGDYTLSATSPCVNNGTNAAWMVGARDLAGNDRIQNVCVDMGAYESPYWGHFSDVDHDGCTDYDEMTYLGTDATNTDSCLGLLTPFTTTGEDGVVIQWQSTTGVLYDVSRVTGLSDPLLFTTLATNVPGQVDSTSYTDTTASAESACFYRISVKK